MRPLLLFCLLLSPPVLAFGISAWVTGNGDLPPMGPVDGRLQPCPPGLDCAGSEDLGGSVEAIPFEGDPDDARNAMLHLLRTESGAEYVDVVGDYMHLVFGRPYLKLVEDVELLLDRENRVFQVRAFERTNSPATGVVERIEGIAERWSAYEARMAATRIVTEEQDGEQARTLGS